MSANEHDRSQTQTWLMTNMQLVPVTQPLASAHFTEPPLRALIPNQDNYTVLLMQPQGDIEADANGVRHHDRTLAHRQCRAFLDDAVQLGADLVVTPEYCMPWSTLVEAITSGVVPLTGRLWALGCESIKYSELIQLQQSLATHAVIIFETLQPDDTRFVDPLAYVFEAPANGSGHPPRLVVLVQFKTCPMGDADHFEVNGLQRGSTVYQFGITNSMVRLTSFLCSDAFALEDAHAHCMYDRGLILHLQLNPQPRQDQYRLSRNRLFYCSNGFTELVCLNWAEGVQERNGATSKPWNNIAGSAWYLQPHDFDFRDATLCANHKHGLYYTWLSSLRSHALFFNYAPATFLLTATKVFHHTVPGSVSRRRGPQLSAVRSWDANTHIWAVQPAGSNDGFASIVAESGGASDEIRRVAVNNPFAAERVLALCAGKIGHTDKWHMLRELDSCGIEANEIIRRITFCQDKDPIARDFRIARLKYCAQLWTILTTAAQLPKALADLTSGFRFDWVPEAPHQNVLSHDNRRATAIYLGETVSEAQVEAVAKKAAEYLGRLFTEPDHIVQARQRLHVWYRNGTGELTLFSPDRYLRFDEPRATSEFDIARDT